jgi:hypothetical protein
LGALRARSDSAGETTAYLGHVKAEPKRHVSGLQFLSDDEARALGSTVARLSRPLVAVAAAEHVYIQALSARLRHWLRSDAQPEGSGR